MELRMLISEVLTVAVIGLMATTVAIPMSVLIADTSGKRMARWSGRVRRILAGAATFLGVAEVLDRQSVRRHPVAASARASRATRTAPRRRAQKRLRTCLMGSLHSGTTARADNLCDVIDLSAGGARVRLVDPMPRFSRITLGLRHFGFFPARVVWRSADVVGLEFDQEPETVVKRMRGLLPQPAAVGAY